MIINGYFMVVMNVIILMDIGWYFINGYQWIFYWWLLMVINGYFIGGY